MAGGIYLDEGEVELINIGLLFPHESFVGRDLDINANDEVPNT